MPYTSMLLTAVILLVFGIAALWGAKREAVASGFFSKDYTTFLKGVAAVIVVFVHFPPEYGNPVQDIAGSFAYVGVTVFFMVSAYGMCHGVNASGRYLSTFWRNRLASLLVPNLLVNAVCYLSERFAGLRPAASVLYDINYYVVILLEFCVVFYIVMLFRGRFRNPRVPEYILIGIVAASGVYRYFTDHVIPQGWCYERMGLVWGILLYRHRDAALEWLGGRRVAKTLALAAVCGVLGVLYLKYKLVWFWGGFLLKIALGLALIVLVVLLTYDRKYNRAILSLGDNSYEIYLSHGFVMLLLAYLLPGLHSGVFIAATFACTLAVSYSVHLLAKPLVGALRK